MFKIGVWFLPYQTEEKSNKLHEAIVSAVTSIPELGVTDEKDITFFFVTDPKNHIGGEVTVEINLSQRPERTFEVLQSLAIGVGGSIKGLYPSVKVECCITTQGFWTSDAFEHSHKNDHSGCAEYGSALHMMSKSGLCPNCGKP
jgi:hypothetical protein